MDKGEHMKNEGAEGPSTLRLWHAHQEEWWGVGQFSKFIPSLEEVWAQSNGQTSGKCKLWWLVGWFGVFSCCVVVGFFPPKMLFFNLYFPTGFLFHRHSYQRQLKIERYLVSLKHSKKERNSSVVAWNVTENKKWSRIPKFSMNRFSKY